MPYSDSIEVISGAVIKKTFSLTNGKLQLHISKSRPDRNLCSLLFCTKSDQCMAAFEILEDYNHHLVKGCSDWIQAEKTRTSMDSVYNKFVTKMKKSSMTKILSGPAERYSNSKLDLVNCQNSPIFSEFNEMGSCLPMRKNFRFREHQKRILLKVFMKDENSGKKVTPEMAAQEIRQQLNRDYYVTPQQVKSLYSRWSKQMQNGTFKDDGNIDVEQPALFENNQRQLFVVDTFGIVTIFLLLLF